MCLRLDELELTCMECCVQVEGAPCVIKKHMNKADAEEVIAKMKGVGAVVVMV